jgi:hypothetical protein
VAWPAAGIERTEVQLDVAELSRAAERIVRLSAEREADDTSG